MADDPLNPLYVLVGTLTVTQLLSGIFGFVRWLGSRTVDREDEDKKEIRGTMKEYEARLAALERGNLALQNEVKSVGASVESIRGSATEVRISVEARLDKQGEFYRGHVKELFDQLTEKFDKTEHDIRQDTTRAIHDAIQTVMVKIAKRGRG